MLKNCFEDSAVDYCYFPFFLLVWFIWMNAPYHKVFEFWKKKKYIILWKKQHKWL